MLEEKARERSADFFGDTAEEAEESRAQGGSTSDRRSPSNNNENHDGANVNGPFVLRCFNGLPPTSGVMAPQSMLDVTSVNVSNARRSFDASGKEVVFYELHVQTQYHSWTVLKRFSDFETLHDTMCKRLKIDEHIARFPKFPSKFHVGKQSTEFVEKRRQELERYMAIVLRGAKELATRCASKTVATNDSLGVREAPPTAVAAVEKKLRALFVFYIEWCKTASFTHQDAATFARVGSLGAATDSVANRDGNNPTSVGDTPPCRVVFIPSECFVVTLYLPGVQMGNVYVGPSERNRRAVVIGGSWGNSHAVPVAGLSPQVMDHSQVVLNTLPTGDFEMVFEIPHPFHPSHWTSNDFVDGVLTLVWKN